MATATIFIVWMEFGMMGCLGVSRLLFGRRFVGLSSIFENLLVFCVYSKSPVTEVIIHLIDLAIY
jgi:hypothetical protein